MGVCVCVRDGRGAAGAPERYMRVRFEGAEDADADVATAVR